MLRSPALVAMLLAGFLFAQVTDVISNEPAKAVTPVAFVVRGKDQQFKLFNGRTLQEMVANARRELASPDNDAWALSYEGHATVEGQRRRALFVEGWARGSKVPVVVIQFLGRSASNSITLLGTPLVLPEGLAPGGRKAIPVAPREMTVEQKRSFEEGMSRLRQWKAKGYIGRRITGSSIWARAPSSADIQRREHACAARVSWVASIAFPAWASNATPPKRVTRTDAERNALAHSSGFGPKLREYTTG